MALPTLQTPTYFLEIPSTKKQIKYRPFLVKEEKILLIAMQEDSLETIFEAVKNVIQNCTFGEVDVESLTTYDLEYIFLQLRIKSKGNTKEVAFKCRNAPNLDENDEPVVCGNVIETTINLEEAYVDGTDNRSNKIILEEETQTGLIMKDPTFETTVKLREAMQDNDLTKIYSNLPKFIDTVFQGENVYDDFSEDEFQEWVENLSDKQFAKIQEFFSKLPKLRLDTELQCDQCGMVETVTLEGLQSFLES